MFCRRCKITAIVGINTTTCKPACCRDNMFNGISFNAKLLCPISCRNVTTVRTLESVRTGSSISPFRQRIKSSYIVSPDCESRRTTRGAVTIALPILGEKETERPQAERNRRPEDDQGNHHLRAKARQRHRPRDESTRAEETRSVARRESAARPSVARRVGATRPSIAKEQ